MTESLGRWPSAPLVYVLAEVRCSPTLDVSGRAAAVQAAIRGQYPLLEPVEVQTGPAIPGGASTSIMYSFTDLAKRRGVIVSSGSLCYHATEYVTSAEFFAELGWVLKAVGPIYEQDSVIRLGLRYVDVIVPKENETVFDYVIPSMTGIPLDASKRVQCVVELPRVDGGIAVRFMALGSSLILSPDLLAISLKRPKWAEEILVAGLQSAILDTDNWNAESRTYDADNLLNAFKGLKKGITEAFLRVASDHAVQEWKKQRRN